MSENLHVRFTCPVCGWGMNLWVDDIRKAPAGWVWAQTAERDKLREDPKLLNYDICPQCGTEFGNEPEEFYPDIREAWIQAGKPFWLKTGNWWQGPKTEVLPLDESEKILALESLVSMGMRAIHDHVTDCRVSGCACQFFMARAERLGIKPAIMQGDEGYEE